MAASARSSRPSRPPRSLKTTLILAAVLVGYAVLQPKLESWFGDDPPPPNNEQAVEFDRSPVLPTEDVATSDRDVPPASAASAPHTQPRDTTDDPLPESDSAEQTPPESATPRLGELRDIGGSVFRSTAGLHYRPGSQEGHRIKHILRHHEDDPDRPVHGVFDGDRNEVFAVIDEAYLDTFDHGPPRVTTEKDDGRTIYRVDLGRRIGYVGGQSGRRQNHPAARHVQLILEGTNVITAYPVRVRQRRD